MLLFTCFCRSPDCFEVGWPMCLDHDYFQVHPSQKCSRQKPQVSDDAADLKKEKGDNDDEGLGVSYTTFALVPPAFGFI